MRNPKALSFLITAGPTVEDIDPVRFISNRASGRLGVEMVRAALCQGHRVIFIHGPLPDAVHETVPSARRLTVVPVRSAADMHREVLRHARAASVIIMNAAVADYTPVQTAAAKIKKSRRGLTLRLRPTVDILKELGEARRRRDDLVLVGFALESGRGTTPAQRRRARLAEARRKLTAKNLDAIVLDTPAAMGAAAAAFTILQRDGTVQRLRKTTKAEFAGVLIGLCERRRREQ